MYQKDEGKKMRSRSESRIEIASVRIIFKIIKKMAALDTVICLSQLLHIFIYLTIHNNPFIISGLKMWCI